MNFNTDYQKRPNLPSHLQPDREIHVIVSTLSGTHTAEAYYKDTLLPFLASHKLEEHAVHRTTSSTSIVELTRKLILFNARKGVKQTILLLSGDGGVVDIVDTMTRLLMRETYDDVRGPSVFFKPVLVLFPCGTANALAWSLGVAGDPLKVLIEGRARSLPAFEVKVSKGTRLVVDEGRRRVSISGDEGDGDSESAEGEVLYGAVVFSWGLHASLVAESDTAEYRKHGVDRFKMVAQELLANPHAYRGQVKYRTNKDENWMVLKHSSSEKTVQQPGIETNASSAEDQHSYILATPLSNLEEKFCISPKSTPLSGKMYLVGFGPETPDEIMRLLGLAYQGGKHVEESNVTYEQIDSLRIEFQEEEERWRMVCVDGKILAVPKDGWVEVRMLPGTGLDGRRVVEVVH